MEEYHWFQGVQLVSEICTAAAAILDITNAAAILENAEISMPRSL